MARRRVTLETLARALGVSKMTVSNAYNRPDQLSPALRQRILDTAYELFYRKGFSRVSVNEIAEIAGITKRSLYYHFDSKDQLLAAVLEAYHELAIARIRKWGVNLSGSRDAMVDSLFADLARWASRPRFTGAGFTRLVMELADLPGHPARAVARRHMGNLVRHHARQLRFALGLQNQPRIHEKESSREVNAFALLGVQDLDRERDLRVRVQDDVLADAVDVFGDDRVGDELRLPVYLGGELASERHLFFV